MKPRSTYNYTESKEEIKRWHIKGGPAKKNQSPGIRWKSNGKNVFGETQLVDNKLKEETIIGAYYSNQQIWQKKL